MIDILKKYKKEIIIFIITVVTTFGVCSGIFYGIYKNKNIETEITNSTSIVYVGSKNSDKYHIPSCQWAQKIKNSNKITFNSESKATSKGYSACKTCID